MPDSPLHEFLLAVARAHRSGAATEPSYYPAIEVLLSTVGAGLKPQVRAVMSLKQLGDGMPDGGLYTAEQLAHGRNAEGAPPLNPGRGAVEAKLPTESIATTIKSAQVKGYAQRHGSVLVTNLREWSLVEAQNGDVHEVERLTLAASADEFWKVTSQPKRFAGHRGADLEAFLQRAMLHAAPLTSPEDLARILAVYAREGLRRAESSTKATGLGAIREAFSEALGFEVQDKEGEHFFRSSLIQALFYGAFSAWVVWCRENKGRQDASFDWKSATWLQHQPAIAVLYDHLAKPGPMNELGLTEVLDWAGDALNRVNKTRFFEQFEDSQAVQYFYEPFLAEFDQKLRQRLGVWYTPPEVVKYMVERVDRALRAELGIERGLADESVVILDPCCGTGSFVIEVLRRIHQTEVEQGAGALAAERVRHAAETRVAGFEIMPAPFVVAHMQVALLLQALGAPLADGHRASIYLSNALTGWEAPDGARDAQFRLQMSSFHELLAERDQAREVKREKRVLVVLGNPPYNAFAGIAGTPEQRALIQPYKDGLEETWGIKKFNLDDPYVQFFRVAERRIVEQTGEGIVCLISNSSYLGHPSFVVMRQRLTANFDAVWLDDLNGDKFATGKRTPDGKPDPSVFSTPLNRAGIEVGTAIGTFVRRPGTRGASAIKYRSFWGSGKREALLSSLADGEAESSYTSIYPSQRAKYSFRPGETGDEWYAWPEVPELVSFQSLGTLENRQGATIDMERESLVARMQKYFDRTIPLAEIGDFVPGLANEETARFDPKLARSNVLEVGFESAGRVRSYLIRPFDRQWAYVPVGRPLWNEPRADLQSRLVGGGEMLLVARRATSAPYGSSVSFSRVLTDQHALKTDVYCLPLSLKASDGFADTGTHPNLSDDAALYLKRISAPVESLLLHVLAIGYASTYQREHEHGLGAGWPRIPLPESAELLMASSVLGANVVEATRHGTCPAGGGCREYSARVARSWRAHGKRFGGRAWRRARATSRLGAFRKGRHRHAGSRSLDAA